MGLMIMILQLSIWWLVEGSLSVFTAFSGFQLEQSRGEQFEGFGFAHACNVVIMVTTAAAAAGGVGGGGGHGGKCCYEQS